MPIDSEPAARAEHDQRHRAVEAIAAACRGRVDVSHQDAADPAALRERVEPGALVTCFDVLDRLPSFAPLVEVLLELVDERGVTLVLSVPNDTLGPAAAGATWAEGAVEELRALLPGDHVAARMVELRGAAVVPEGATAPDSTAVDGDVPDAPFAWLLAFGPEATRLAATASVAGVDAVGQRRWERQRSSDLEYYRATHDGTAAERDELAQTVRDQSRRMDEWRAYIHELEGRLGLPPSGVSFDEAPPAGESS